MDFKGTKGEWRPVTQYLEVTTSRPGILEGSKSICAIASFGKTDEESQANLRLIAAAPELLQALHELIQVKDWKDKYGKDEQYLKSQPIAWENAIEAVKKATK